jgi:hypothetical protein
MLLMQSKQQLSTKHKQHQVLLLYDTEIVGCCTAQVGQASAGTAHRLLINSHVLLCCLNTVSFQPTTTSMQGACSVRASVVAVGLCAGPDLLLLLLVAFPRTGALRVAP